MGFDFESAIFAAAIAGVLAVMVGLGILGVWAVNAIAFGLPFPSPALCVAGLIDSTFVVALAAGIVVGLMDVNGR